MSTSTGYISACLDCSGCKKSFSVAAAVGKGIEKLPDPFAAQCPYYDEKKIYKRANVYYRASVVPAYDEREKEFLT
ncbi:hypothetical protein [Rhodoblastus sp.]|uniref:hypothetical protein n=1 Tax=Rhodoblastus sp. TaxID=1962975 RepID=UPI00260C1F8D|nr:hypothetical protein [Rhodoblastus sp.]